MTDTVPSQEDIRLDRLENGLRVVTEEMTGVASVALGCWVGVGARDEPASLAGVSHFLEHLLFKGTPGLTAREIAMAVDARGGEMNAFTGKEQTAFYLRLPAREWAWGVELLADVLSDPALRPDEVDAEREVILEEILSSLDDPDDRAHSLLFEGLFPDHEVGREVLGDAETVGTMPRDEIATFHGDRYGPASFVVAAAGAVRHGEVVDLLVELLADPGGVTPERRGPAGDLTPVRVETRSTEQVHVCVGWRAYDQHHPDRYALAVLNHVLGGSASSRLFQEVREQRGLAYSVWSAPTGLSDTGALSLYAGTGPGRCEEMSRVVAGVIDDLLSSGVTEQELEVARGALSGSLVLGLEDTGSRMGRLGSNVAARGRVTPIAEHVASIGAVTVGDVARVAHDVLGGLRTVAAVGPVSEESPALAPLL